jgi:peptidoglycan/xylan/chitin deacetylase (PgdA/CDA1 family)
MNILKVTIITKIRRGIYITLGFFDQYLNRKNKINIFCYHSVSNNKWRFSIKPKDFKKQIDYITKHYEYCPLEDIFKVAQDKSKLSYYSITFDDGYNDLLNIVPYLKNLEIKPTLFMLSDKLHIVKESLDSDLPLLSNKNLKKLIAAGWSIQSHGQTHAILTELTTNHLENEIFESKEVIEHMVGKKVTSFSYPCGKYNNKVINFIKKSGYKYAFSMDDGFINKTTDKYSIPRIGVDASHSFSEFKYLGSPSVILFRKLIKSTFIGNYL